MQGAPDPTKGSLPEPGRRLVEMMQSIWNGRIERLKVRNSLPSFDPPPKTTRFIKLAAATRTPSKRVRDDFVLKRPVVNLFDELERQPNVVVTIEVQDGLPYMIRVSEDA